MVDRRTVAKGIAGLGVAAAAGRRGWADAATDPIARITDGRLRGSFRDGVVTFLGVPYGAPTGGAGRFMPPRPVASWTGVREAAAFGGTCPQIPLGMSPFARQRAPGDRPPAPTAMQAELATLFPRSSRGARQDEDCLMLNVWTPALDSARRPVMVWLHGGGFAVGSGSSAAYDGARLAKRGDVVVVTLNHRLNVFGYLYLGDIAGEAFAQSGNVGMLDIVAALRWVRRNIAAFGGDPHNVTIFGESGGAGKVSVVCAMPAAKGLFHKAIMQSGPCLTIQDKARGTAIARQLLADLGLSANQVAALQKMDAPTLAAAADAAELKIVPRVLGFGPMGLVPLVDGAVLHHDPFDPAAPPESKSVPFLVGSTKDEATLFAGPLPDWDHLTDADVLEKLRPMAGGRSRQALDLYRTLHPSDSPSYLLVDVVTDFWMRRSATRVAELKARQNGAPAFVYRLDWQVNSLLRTPHGADVPLVFDNVAASTAVSAAPGAQTVSDQMSAAWLAFARTGDPNAPALPHWPAYSVAARPTMLFDLESRVADDFDRRQREFWEGV